MTQPCDLLLEEGVGLILSMEKGDRSYIGKQIIR